MTDATPIRERWNSVRALRAPRHREEAGDQGFAGSFTALGQVAYAGAKVSASVVDLRSGRALVEIDDRIVLPTASVGKVLLLVEVAARLTAHDLSGYAILDKPAKEPVADSGLWQHLQAPALPIADLAALVGATSDNLATNALLAQVGLDAVRLRTESLGLLRTALLDRVRNSRGPDDAPQLSVASTAELSWLFGALARGEIVNAATSRRVVGWLSLNVDLSLVASAFGLDPLAHGGTDHGTMLVNKTGTDAGVRAEAGVVRGARSSVAYAVSVQFDDAELSVRLRVLEAMRAVGADIMDYIH